MAYSKDNSGNRARPRIVVTGMGAVSPFGVGLGPLWEGLAGGRQPIGKVGLFDVEGHRTEHASLVPDDAVPTSQDSRRLSRTDRFALLAAREAWESANLGDIGSHPQAGLFFGTCTGGMLEGESAFLAWDTSVPERARFKSFGLQTNGTPADMVAREFGLCGPIEIVASACAASTMAIEAALDSIRSGEVEIALVGGADGMCRTSFEGFNALRAIDPECARPFRAERAGLILGEGAGVLVLESEQHALARGAEPLAVVAGASSTCDAYHMTAPDPEGVGVVRAMRAALEDAELPREAIAFLNAHGSGTPHNDVAEAKAIAEVFGERTAKLPVTSTKGAIGHGLGTCGALEAIATLQCLRNGVVHPTPGVGPVDPETPVDLVLGEPRRLVHARAAMSINLAFGGANAAVVLCTWEGANPDA
ncbi:MAG: 3-oxoacyl-[acyl-carrier-protein] synthase II [Planctomycetota bacterium]|jgi:3-oxoacyl-[acyl-carrier-protein] synthase II